MSFIRDLGLWRASQVNFQDDSAGKESDYNVGDTGDAGSIPGQEDSLEKEMATHSSILFWKIPWTEDWWAPVHGVAKNQIWLSD